MAIYKEPEKPVFFLKKRKPLKGKGEENVPKEERVNCPENERQLQMPFVWDK